MALPASGQISFLDIWLEYYKFLPHFSQDIDMLHLYSIYGLSPPVGGRSITPFYNKFVVRSYFTNISDNDPANPRTAIFGLPLEGQTTGTSNIALDYEMYGNIDNGELDLTLESSRNNGASWNLVNQINLIGPGSQSVNNAFNLNSISVAESSQIRFRCTALYWSGSGDYYIDVTRNAVTLSSPEGVSNTDAPHSLIFDNTF